MPYAVRDDVIARVGRVAGYFTVAGNRPNLADIDAFLDELSTDVDEAIRGMGFDPAAIDTNAQKALLDLVAWGAAARAVRGMGDRSPEVLQILVEADVVWTAAMGDPSSRQADAIQGSIRRGDHPVIRALQAGQAGGGEVISAGVFWEEEPNYGRPEALLQEWYALYGTNLAPGFSKGQHF